MQRSKTSPPNAAAATSPNEEWLRLDVQLCFALYSSSLAMTKFYKPLLDPLGLTYPQYLAMLVLWEQDGISVSALGQKLSLDSGTLTPLLKRLEAAELITRERAADDERRVHIHLSKTGRALKKKAAGIPEQVACASACSIEELSSLTRRLHELRTQIQAASLPLSPTV
ncbi:MarR family transcriptional regulator [Paucibacter sp. R3-3]|uniref:MarR family transcriptional regulator n=1 Tax=Roseateles agri TaxID=3098619 RepID=A0ABU5DH80_9BURK|nr:MarR family transcriptional regulator [Paucibacter sp. R3-3]MDY0745641.1 MarR family transcriptional regulator [Paucibacter sp. R3-3]